MSISFAYTKTKTLEVWKGVFYSPDHDPELNRDPDFLENTQSAALGYIGEDHLISLYNAEGTNLLLNITGTLEYDSSAYEPVDIENFQLGGISDIRSNDDSVLLNYSCKDITSSNFDNFKWEKVKDENAVECAFIHKIYASYRNQDSENLVISGKIINQLPTCGLKILVGDKELEDIGIGGKVDIDLGSESFTIRLFQIKDAEKPHYLEDFILEILEGGDVNLESLERLVMFRQTYGQNKIDSLDIVGFSLEATTLGTGNNFTLDLKYTLNTDPDEEVPPAVNNIGLMLIDPLDLKRPESIDINKKGLYNFIDEIVTVTADASNPVVSLTAVDGYIVIGEKQYDGFDATAVISEKQPKLDSSPIDIPMTIFLPDGASRVDITPSTELNGVPHDWNVWSDPQEAFGIVYNDGNDNIIDEVFEGTYRIANSKGKGMDSIDIVFRIHQKEYWNGDFNLGLRIDSYKGEDQQGQANYELPDPISIEPKDSTVLVRQVAGGGGAIPF